MTEANARWGHRAAWGALGVSAAANAHRLSGSLGQTLALDGSHYSQTSSLPVNEWRQEWRAAGRPSETMQILRVAGREAILDSDAAKWGGFIANCDCPTRRKAADTRHA